MSKGIAVHILITIVFIILYWWVTDGIEVDVADKLTAIMILFTVNAFAALGMSMGDYYKEKL